MRDGEWGYMEWTNLEGDGRNDEGRESKSSSLIPIDQTQEKPPLSLSLSLSPPQAPSVNIATRGRKKNMEVNITAILDALQTGYDKRIRPNYGGEEKEERTGAVDISQEMEESMGLRKEKAACVGYTLLPSFSSCKAAEKKEKMKGQEKENQQEMKEQEKKGGSAGMDITITRGAFASEERRAARSFRLEPEE
ncbi:unnamed protein product [Darwinula stevensoni]|uniref:Uncharacterized protein n=1 Tax=Darwinula stevensoni TaxID=69355 RepID=A0A7R8X5J0_9CRUS|nr:unnamed protein product [Darwinula stevensoni]CAG0880487.1 unnamed protein product [Darwinula stevensoni]